MKTLNILLHPNCLGMFKDFLVIGYVFRTPEETIQASKDIDGHVTIIEIPIDQPMMPVCDWEALWSYHHEAEFTAAGKQEYDDAKYHHQRAKEIRAFLNNRKKR